MISTRSFSQYFIWIISDDTKHFPHTDNTHAKGAEKDAEKNAEKNAEKGMVKIMQSNEYIFYTLCSQRI